MKTDVVVVLYNPSLEFFKNYEGYFEKFNKVFFMDNSTNENKSIHKEKVLSHPNGEYVDLEGNQGIALALYKGAEMAIKDGADYLLTMDQDSEFPFDKVGDVLRIIEAHPDYGIITLNINSDEADLSIKDENQLITSGSFINLELYGQLDRGFDEKLFIDLVDFDLNYQFYKKNIPMGYIKGISLKHTMGKPIKKRIFNRTIIALNETPIRYYYMVRNTNYLYKYVSKDFFAINKKRLKKDILKIILFEKQKMQKLKFIIKGARDGRKGKLGKLEM